MHTCIKPCLHAFFELSFITVFGQSELEMPSTLEPCDSYHALVSSPFLSCVPEQTKQWREYQSFVFEVPSVNPLLLLTFEHFLLVGKTGRHRTAITA